MIGPNEIMIIGAIHPPIKISGLLVSNLIKDRRVLS